MKRIYRIHGDNIVECERIANLILNEVHPKNKKAPLVLQLPNPSIMRGFLFATIW